MLRKTIGILSLFTLFLLPNNSYTKSPEDQFLDRFFEQCEQFLSREECQNIIKKFKEASANTKKLNMVISSISKICQNREGMIYGYHWILDSEEDASKEIEIAKYLIENNADIDTINHQNKSMLSVAAEANSPALTQWLIDNGANIDLVDYRGITALFIAITYNSPQALEVLLQNGATITITGAEEVALFFAKQLGNTQIEKLLSQHIQKSS